MSIFIFTPVVTMIEPFIRSVFKTFVKANRPLVIIGDMVMSIDEPRADHGIGTSDDFGVGQFGVAQATDFLYDISRHQNGSALINFTICKDITAYGQF